MMISGICQRARNVQGNIHGSVIQKVLVLLELMCTLQRTEKNSLIIIFYFISQKYLLFSFSFFQLI